VRKEAITLAARLAANGPLAVALTRKLIRERRWADAAETAAILRGADAIAPGAADRLGLEPAALRDAYPSLIVVAISGYGVGGPTPRPARPTRPPCRSAGVIGDRADGDIDRR
jgi:CoA-transferase family III